MRRETFSFLAAASLSALSAAPALAFAAEVPDALAELPPAEREKALKFEQSLHPQTGVISVPAAHASLNLGDRYYFLPPAEAKKVLINWGNAPDSLGEILGIVFPRGAHSYDEGWAAVITYEDSGHVKDDDATKQDYDQVLADMKAGEKEGNDEARKQGYPGSVTIGWAQKPTYDSASKTLIWARNIKFDKTDENTLNYDIRKLGRTGVLSMNMVDVMPRLDSVRVAAADLGKTVSFDRGQSYADYNSATDHTADYGLAGLVAAGAGLLVAKKLGLIGLALLFLKKGFVVVAAAAAGAWAWFKRKRGKGDVEA